MIYPLDIYVVLKTVYTMKIEFLICIIKINN